MSTGESSGLITPPSVVKKKKFYLRILMSESFKTEELVRDHIQIVPGAVYIFSDFSKFEKMPDGKTPKSINEVMYPLSKVIIDKIEDVVV